MSGGPAGGILFLCTGSAKWEPDERRWSGEIKITRRSVSMVEFIIYGRCTSQQKLDTNFKFFYSKDWFSVQCYGCLDTSLFGWLECIRYGVIVKPACAPLMRLRALQSLHT